MKKINEIEITINKAVVTGITVKLDDSKGLIVETTGQLISNTGLPVSTFYYSSDAWNDSQKIDVPMSTNLPARELFEIMQVAIIEKIQGSFMKLESGKK